MLVRDVLRTIFLPASIAVAAGVGVLAYYHSSSEFEPESDIEEVQAKVKQPVVATKLPDFSSYSSVKAKKKAFFAFMLPLVQEENQRLVKLRRQLQALKAQLSEDQVISAKDTAWVLTIAEQYGVDIEQSQKSMLKQLLRRVDAVPPSLALAQAANESAWGTSRFALRANNLFGQWCFAKGCGVIPKQRPEGASYEVAKFKSPVGSVKSYIHNLNTFSAYAYFRELRKSLRDNQQLLSGNVLAEGLLSYSARGEAYIDELRAMIRVNGLAKYDQLQH